MTFLLFLLIVFYAPSAWGQDFVCGFGLSSESESRQVVGASGHNPADYRSGTIQPLIQRGGEAEVSSYTPQASDVGYRLRATVSYRDGESRHGTDEDTASERIAGKLGAGLLSGVVCVLPGVFLVGPALATNANCDGGDTFCELGYSLLGGYAGYVVGVSIGVSIWDSHDRFMYSLAGSILGAGAAFAVKSESFTIAICSPLIMATLASEWFRDSPETRRFSVGLAAVPDTKGRLSAVAVLRF